MKTLVAYFSRTGNNRYLAARLARDFGADLRELKPRVKAFPVMVLFSLAGWPLGLSRDSRNTTGYDRLIVCGPLWMGKLCLPVLDFLRSAKKKQTKVHLITCCGSKDAAKDDTFGYGRVFTELEAKFGAALGQTQALPIELVLPEDQRALPEAIMAARLTDETLVGPIAERYQSFVQKL